MAEAEQPVAARPGTLLKSWSRRHAWPAEVVTVASADDWHRLVERAGRENLPLIARGGGLSWTDIAMTAGGLVAMTGPMQHILDFDATAGVLTAQGGVSLRTLLDLILPAGWTLHSLPGSLDVTLGGAIGCNVHGKDAHRHGSFCEQVAQIVLADGGGACHRLTPVNDPEGFAAAAGGMGLLGLVCEATLHLTPLPPTTLHVTERRIEGATDLAGLFDTAGRHDFAWGWLDPAAAARGRIAAIVRQASWQVGQAAAVAPQRRGRTRPWRALAPFVSNSRLRRTLSWGHVLRRHSLGQAGRTRTADWRRVLFPHEGLRGLDELFAAGFVEVQAIVPAGRLAALFADLAGHADDTASRPFLVSFKLHRASIGDLAFAGDGIALAFVIAAAGVGHQSLEARRRVLRDAVLTCGGRINLARDDGLTLEEVCAMYPGFVSFATAKARFDPERRLVSAFWQRLADSNHVA